MTMQRYNKYQYETSPRKLEPEYRTVQKKYPKKSTAPKSKVVPQKKNVTRKAENTVNKRKVVMAVAFVFASIFAISYRNSQIDEAFNKNEEMKAAYIAVEKENDQMKVDIENSLNLSNVEQEAKELLGMQKLSNKQTIYINLPKKDYIQPATESITENKDNNIINNIFKIWK